MKNVNLMCCVDSHGEYELWFDDDKNLLGGYFRNDAIWRGEYFDGIMGKLGISISYMDYNAKIAREAVKKLFGL